MKDTCKALAGALAMFCALPQAESLAAGRAGQFDFYVLSLSWSPSWCAANPDASRSAQCDPTRNFGFIVHGLWPQNESGYPEFCATREPDRVPENLGRRYFDIIPSMGLMGHEWRKHGTCSGLNQTDYFSLLREAYEKISIPPQLANPAQSSNAKPADIEKSFLGANPGLSAGAIAVTCSNRRLEEVRICLNRDLTFRDCAEVDRRACTLNSITIPPIP